MTARYRILGEAVAPCRCGGVAARPDRDGPEQCCIRAKELSSLAAPARPEHRLRGRRGRWLLRHASDSQTRLQAAANRAACKHFGDSCSRDKAGLSADPAEDSTASRPEMRACSELRVACRRTGLPCIHIRAGVGGTPLAWPLVSRMRLRDGAGDEVLTLLILARKRSPRPARTAPSDVAKAHRARLGRHGLDGRHRAERGGPQEPAAGGGGQEGPRLHRTLVIAGLS